MSVYYVYEDWTTETSPRCFYVGKGLKSRINDIRRNKHHVHIVQKYGLQRKVVLTTLDEYVAFNHEKQLIVEHKTFVRDPDCVFGANYTQGGEGTSGTKFEWSTKRRYDASQAQKRAFQRQERRIQHAEATKKQWLDGARKLKQIERLRQNNPSHTHPDTDETRKRKSDGQKQRFKLLTERQRMSELTRKSCQNPEVFEKRSLAQKNRRRREHMENQIS